MSGVAGSQKKLYYNFYGFAMGICLRYARNRDEAVEILNDGFYKVLTRLDKYDPSKPFLPWLSRIMTNTAIDHYRAELKHPITSDLAELEIKVEENDIQSKLNYEDLLKLVQALPPGYRTVFNLFAIDGFTHEEIAKQLGISVGTSKSNLFKARQKLMSMLELNDTTTEINTSQNTGINFNEQFEPKQDRQIFQTGT
jgi:RNA polymerase sigma-70 factor (ECF subfamily)